MNRTVAIIALALLLPGCVASIGDRGPEGPPGPIGPAGPTGPPNSAPQRLAMTRATADYLVGDADDVVIADGASLAITLPAARAAGPGRTITVRASNGKARLIAGAGDSIDAATSFALDRDEMVTVISDGGSRWTIISSSDL
jgi:hypothetical protein